VLVSSPAPEEEAIKHTGMYVPRDYGADPWIWLRALRKVQGTQIIEPPHLTSEDIWFLYQAYAGCFMLEKVRASEPEADLA
jgi:hypothetical protein